MFLLLDVASPIPEFHLINDKKIIDSIKITNNTDQKLSDVLIPTYLKIDNDYKLSKKLKKLNTKISLLVVGGHLPPLYSLNEYKKTENECKNASKTSSFSIKVSITLLLNSSIPIILKTEILNLFCLLFRSL